MDENKKKLDFSIGIFDNITDKIKTKLIKDSNSCGTYAVGVYTDKYIIENLMTYPLKPLEERITIAQSLEGVDFVFIVDSSDRKEIKKIIEKKYEDYLKKNKN